MFIYENLSLNILVVGVLDGHGREVGRIAAQSAREALRLFFAERDSQLISDPVSCLKEAFVNAHASIKAAFRAYFVNSGWEVAESDDGYLIKRKMPSQSWSCIHGGSSCSIVALFRNEFYSANVGDSSVTLCLPREIPMDEILTNVVDAAVPSDTGSTAAAIRDDNVSSTLVVSAEHSPESPDEYYRLRNFRHRVGDASLPALYVVYDAPAVDKALCPSIFTLDPNGDARVTNKGR